MELSAVDGVGISPLGSGSDYTVFLQRIGVCSFLLLSLSLSLTRRRYQVRTEDSAQLSTTQCTITIPYLILSDGKNCTVTQGSIVM